MVGVTSGVSEMLLKAHGRWVSDKALDGYVKDNIHFQMAVSLNLAYKKSVFFRSVLSLTNLFQVSSLINYLNLDDFKKEFKCISILVICNFPFQFHCCKIEIKQACKKYSGLFDLEFNYNSYLKLE